MLSGAFPLRVIVGSELVLLNLTYQVCWNAPILSCWNLAQKVLQGQDTLLKGLRLTLGSRAHWMPWARSEPVWSPGGPLRQLSAGPSNRKGLAVRPPGLFDRSTPRQRQVLYLHRISAGLTVAVDYFAEQMVLGETVEPGSRIPRSHREKRADKGEIP